MSIKIKRVRLLFLLLLSFTLIIISMFSHPVILLKLESSGLIITPDTAHAGAPSPDELVQSISAFYFSQAKDFAVDFKVDSKLKDIAFEGKFRLRAPFDFFIDAKSSALEVKIAFKNGDGFIYLPAANIITNLDSVTRIKTGGIKIPSSVEQLNERLKKLNGEFELEASDDKDIITLGGLSKTGRGSFKAVIDKSSFEIKSISTFNKKGVHELLITLKNFKYEPAAEKLFEKPQGAIETNLPIPVF